MNRQKLGLAGRVMVVSVASLVTLSACGEAPGERALSGAALGAGTGALGTAVFGGNPTTGALIGGAAGAAFGGLTSPRDVYFGEPLWRRRYYREERYYGY